MTTAREAGCNDLMLLHCISNYPAPMDQAKLRQIPELAKRFAGLSDHTMGTTASVAAIALGACLNEKHFTLSRAIWMGGGEVSRARSEAGDSSRLAIA